MRLLLYTEQAHGVGNHPRPSHGWRALQGVHRHVRDPEVPDVAAFMSAHSKTPYITPSMDISSGEGVVRGRRVQQLTFALPRLPALGRGWWTARWPGTRKRAANSNPQVGFFFNLVPFVPPPPAPTGVHRTCGGTNELQLTDLPMGYFVGRPAHG